MSLMFLAMFLDHPVHVLQVRGRPAFLAREIGAAAGHADGGERFVTLLTREWAPSFEDDDDVAYLTGRELDAVKRDLALPDSTPITLVLFASGVEKALAKSEARFARALGRYLNDEVYPRCIGENTVPAADDDGDGESDPCPAAPPPAAEPDSRRAVATVDEVIQLRALRQAERMIRYDALRRYAAIIKDHGGTVEEYLTLERHAVEAIVGYGLHHLPPPAPISIMSFSAENEAAA